MGRVLTNATSLSYAREMQDSPGTPDGPWRLLEPNSITQFSAEVTKVAPSPISRNRQRRKGFISDLDSGIAFEADVTLSGFRDFIEGFCFAVGTNGIVTDMTVASVAATGYTLPANLTAAQIAILKSGALVYARGFGESANNGLRALSADTAATTAVPTGAGSRTVEATGGLLSFSGYRTNAKPVWVWAAGTKRATLTLNGLGTTLLAQNLKPGQTVHIGSPSGNTLGNAAGDQSGFARVVSITANVVTFDKTDESLQANSVAANVDARVDILFGQFVRNVKVGDADYLERSYVFEGDYPGLGAGGVSNYRYSIGNYASQASMAIPLTDRAGLTLGFIGTDTEDPTAVRKAGAANAVEPDQTARYSTTGDVARLRIADLDETGLTTDFKSLTITLGNNVSPEKVVGRLGALFMNFGNFDVALEAQVLFTSGAVLAAIRANDTVSMDFILNGDDGIIAMDVPAMTLGGGGLDLPLNETVLLNATGEAFGDPTLNTSIGVSLIPGAVA